MGGYVRDKLLGRASDAHADDIDLVLEGNALAVADFLWKKRVADHRPVEYGQFGTTQVVIKGVKVEIVTARSETYRQGSRKPIVKPGTLQTDAERRDFTINTFLENLETGEILDLTGQGRADLTAGLLRTPFDPNVIFSDDALRMLRACRFAAKLGFRIEEGTWVALLANADKCNPEHDISYERIREELVKTLLTADAPRGLELMRASGLLDQFAPELTALYGVTQNRYHRYDVWEHTLVALRNLPPDAPLHVRLGVLLHDIGKPTTRTVDEAGEVHFYGHEDVGAKLARTILTRLRFSNEEIESVVALVGLHMRYGAYDPQEWTDAAVRRLIRIVGPHRRDLFAIARADIAACNTDDFPTADLDGLSERMEKIEAESHITTATSPLDGQAICALLGIKPGPLVGKIKNTLTDAVVGGELAPDDTEGAAAMARDLYARLTA